MVEREPKNTKKRKCIGPKQVDKENEAIKEKGNGRQKGHG
jgi:hypothetical protein